MKYEIIIAGIGGQGVVISGILLAQAGLLSGMHAAQSGSYSAQVRGAYTRADLVLSDEPVDYPYATLADALVCLSSEGLSRGIAHLKEDGLLLLDSTVISPDEQKNLKAGSIVSIPATRIATDLGRAQSANLVLLGALLKKTGILTEEKLREALTIVLKGKSLDVNFACLEKGLEAAS
ncbi:MAG: 2-oxoacid:acceptor oxidoreductase family protein [Nitrospirota bacterium]|nr:2-oxoacid:acceptor oxidoreductase family protein [Nitrospirota bacterium]